MHIHINVSYSFIIFICFFNYFNSFAIHLNNYQNYPQNDTKMNPKMTLKMTSRTHPKPGLPQRRSGKAQEGQTLRKPMKNHLPENILHLEFVMQAEF